MNSWSNHEFVSQLDFVPRVALSDISSPQKGASPMPGPDSPPPRCLALFVPPIHIRRQAKCLQRTSWWSNRIDRLWHMIGLGHIESKYYPSRTFAHTCDKAAAIALFHSTVCTDLLASPAVRSWLSLTLAQDLKLRKRTSCKYTRLGPRPVPILATDSLSSTPSDRSRAC